MITKVRGYVIILLRFKKILVILGEFKLKKVSEIKCIHIRPLMTFKLILHFKKNCVFIIEFLRKVLKILLKLVPELKIKIGIAKLFPLITFFYQLFTFVLCFLFFCSSDSYSFCLFKKKKIIWTIRARKSRNNGY